MIKLRETVVVEGKYDKARLSNLLDANILTTDGFGIFTNGEKRALLRRLAANGGLVVMTDSDRAGFRIRACISGMVPAGQLRQVYIPDILGKESRKAAPSKEGKLGVEGVDDGILLECLARAGITAENTPPPPPRDPITKYDLYELGLSGRPEAAVRRRELLARLDLPASLTSNALVRVLNLLYTREEFFALTEQR